MLGSAKGPLFLLLMRPILLLVAVASVAGVPLALLYGNKWLNSYPYRVEFSPWMFGVSLAVMLVIVALTVLYHFAGLVRINPVEVLRRGE
jgi:putative ABC transport system permease protein